MLSPDFAISEMRTFLTERYPSVSFDLTLSCKLSEISINVRWWNGPTEFDVEELLDHFRSIKRSWRTDETGRPAAHDVLEESLLVNAQGELEVRLYTPMQINCERLFTREVLERAAREVSQSLHLRRPEVIDTIAEVLLDNGIDIDGSPAECRSSLGKYFDIDDHGVCHEGIPLREMIMDRLRRRRFSH